MRSPARRTLAGFLFALAAGSIWGTTVPLSTALYAEGQQLAGLGGLLVALFEIPFQFGGVALTELRARGTGGRHCR